MRGEVGSFFKSWVMRGFGPGSWQDLGGALSSLGLLLGILVGFWEALGLSWAALGLLLGRLGRSWEALGLSWAALGRLLDDLGLSWTALVRSRAALERSWAPCWSQVGPQEAQSRPQDPPKSRPRRSKMALICKTIFRTPFWELP